VDTEGDIWVTTTTGVDKFRDLAVATFSIEEGISSTDVSSVVPTRDGGIWAGDLSSLERIKDGRVSSIDKSKGLPGSAVTSLFEDHGGRLWLGVDNRIFRYSGGKFRPFDKAGNIPVGPLKNLVQDTDGVMWATIMGLENSVMSWSQTGTPKEIALGNTGRLGWVTADPSGGVFFDLGNGDLGHYRNGKWDMMLTRSTEGAYAINELAFTVDHAVLAATRVGVEGWRDGKVHTLGLANGMPCLASHALVLDQQQTLWVYTQCGLVSIANGELQRWWHDPNAKIKMRVFDALDGVQTSTPEYQPAAAMSVDGKIWSATGFALQQIDPMHLPKNTIIPPVNIESMIADRKVYALKPELRLPALTRDLEIDYTALSFPISQRVRFRYRLDGWDTVWQDANTRRQAFYTGLGPGTYTFHVIACNNDGLWNNDGAKVVFSIVPTFYQTLWFRFLCVAATLGALWIFYLIRLNQVTGQLQQRLGARMEERERIARELHDTLLQGVQGLILRFQAVMRRLPEREPTRQMMEKVLDRADEVLLEGRQRVRELRAEGTTGDDLAERLKHCAEELVQDYPIAFNLVIVGTTQLLDPSVYNEVYQIAREAMTNAFQHSNGTLIEIEITYDPASFRVVIRDDGRGIEKGILNVGRAGHWGLSGMRERGRKIGAKLNIWSPAGRGTEVDLVVQAKVAYRRSVTVPLWRRLRKAICDGRR
jgi:signal transduction histidine kinase